MKLKEVNPIAISAVIELVIFCAIGTALLFDFAFKTDAPIVGFLIGLTWGTVLVVAGQLYRRIGLLLFRLQFH